MRTVSHLALVLSLALFVGCGKKTEKKSPDKSPDAPTGKTDPKSKTVPKSKTGEPAKSIAGKTAKTTGPTTAKKRSQLFLSHAKLVGTWNTTITLDEAKLKAAIEAGLKKQLKTDTVPPAALEAALKEAKASPDLPKGPMKMLLVVNDDGTSKSTTTPPGESEDSKWEVVSETGNTAKLKITSPSEGEYEITVEIVDADTFKLTSHPAPMAFSPFKRQK